MPELTQFIQALKDHPCQQPVFNPWYEVDRHYDAQDSAPLQRRRHLEAYLSERLSSARTLLVAEAVGYQGGHFSGMAMTSERILLDKHTHKGIRGEDVINTVRIQRTSKPEARKEGFNEPTATIVWSHLLNIGVNPREFVLWNAFAWHPYHESRGMLSNRTPTNAELAAAQPVLQQFLGLFPEVAILAVGKKCEQVLHQMGVIPQTVLRHPANGGANLFRQQFSEFFRNQGK